MKKVKRAIALTAALAMTAMSVPAVFAENYSDAVVSEACENNSDEEIYTSTLDVPNTKVSGDWIYSVNSDGTTCEILEYIGAGGDVVIPDTLGVYTVTGIDYYAFIAAGLTGITIPSTVSYISDNIYHNYVSDEERENIQGVSYRYNPYNKSNTLTSIKVASGSKYFTAVDGVLYNYQMTGLVAYPGAKKSTSFSVPDGVSRIGYYAFANSKYITAVTLPDSVKYIESSAFQGCTKLTSINLPEGITSLSGSIFAGCSSLSSITIPESTKNIGSSAFRSCTSLTTVTVPANVSYIGYGAFSYCTSLKSINVRTANETYCSISGILYDKNMTEIMAFPAGLTVSSFAVPSGISSIGEYAFEGAKISSVSIPSSVIVINDYAFSDCTNMSAVSMNVGLKTIGDQAFYNCPKLLNVTVPDGVLRIGNSAFAKSYENKSDSTRTFTIPTSVTAIAQYAFGYGLVSDEAAENGYTVPNVLLRLYKGSNAEKYAQKYNYKYEYIGDAKPVITKAVAGDGQVAVNWTAVSGATNYAVYYKSGSSWVSAGTTTACGKYVKGLTNGTKYAFIVKAYVNGSWSTSDVVYATPGASAAKPKITKAVAGDGQVALNWTAVDGATKYSIYTYLNGKYTCIGSRTAKGMYVTGLTNGTKYGFLVRAYVNGAWTSYTTNDIVYATPTAAKASLIDVFTDDIEFVGTAPVLA